MSQTPTGNLVYRPAGFLPPADETATQRTFSAYVHIPFCVTRCGYCDFNTYTTTFGVGADLATYADSVIAEIKQAEDALGQQGYPPRKLYSVFFGGGTPTMLDPDQLARILSALTETFGLEKRAEVTIEANPDTVNLPILQRLKQAGFTRVSFGMQSAVPHVLKTLERSHDPLRMPQVVRWAREAGLQVSLDLIYGTPGESLDDWKQSVNTALLLSPDHISAYSLIIEPGTRLANQIERGEVAPIDEDEQAEKYEIVDEMLASQGYQWYEISNWAWRSFGEAPVTGLRYASRHNLAYWRGGDWWGFGPGAHSHFGMVRWWNRKHPGQYAQALREGISPAVDGEEIDAEAARLEEIMLMVRTGQGLIANEFVTRAVSQLIREGLIQPSSALCGRIILTRKGRLLADSVTHFLVENHL
ncbi:coproporphyrinogen III oxidase [Boudabousia tangfeifanii]|uniref:Heme chaperone HemW n=1 Tax=Boudabousia tangfeifanii TaxID=1912795 RepID=A0A1D9MKT5_9ACTO|nr:radical SAM family heme chaperone HemW [Boudabousia tangfeifanii]AOZ72924.1 coproporphyrinogen III oxidase [Boudabousia tangfeifanii]